MTQTPDVSVRCRANSIHHDKICTCHSMRCLDRGIRSIRNVQRFKARSRNHQKRSKLVVFPAPASMKDPYHFQVVCVCVHFQMPPQHTKAQRVRSQFRLEIHCLRVLMRFETRVLQCGVCGPFAQCPLLGVRLRF